MTDVVLNNITSGYNISKINDNFDKIKSNLNSNVVHISGGGNIMGQDLDMNSNKILNTYTDVDDPNSLVNVGALNTEKEERISGDLTNKQYAENLVAGVVGGYGFFQQEGTGATQRTFQDKERDFVSIKDFGGKGDGTFNNSSIINNLNSLGSPVFLPKGTYYSTVDLTTPTYGPGVLKVKGMTKTNGNTNRSNWLKNTYRKHIIADIPQHPTPYDEIVATYSYDYIYPQGFFIDEEANELWICYFAQGGNNWEWWCVRDLTTFEEKTTFSASVGVCEVFSLYREGSSRYLLATNANGNLDKFDVTTLPASLSRLTEVSSYPIRVRFSVSVRGDTIYTETNGNGNESAQSVYTLWNKDMSLAKGQIYFNELELGSPGPTTDDGMLNKKQGLAVGDGFFVGSFGGACTEDGILDPPPYTHRWDNGVKILSKSGEVIIQSLIDGPNFMYKLRDLGYPAERVECEGVHVTSDNRIFTLVVTQPSTTGDTDAQGILLIEEFSDHPDAVDFSDISTSYTFASQDKVWYPTRATPTLFDLMNPVTGESIQSMKDLATYMKNARIKQTCFYTSSITIVDPNTGVDIPSGIWVTVSNRNGSIFDVIMMTNTTQSKYAYSLDSDSSFGVSNFILGYIVSSPPTTGTYAKGALAFNSSPDSGEPAGWMCTVAGSPGTWKAFGTLA
jgi:hypothetical protein